MAINGIPFKNEGDDNEEIVFSNDQKSALDAALKDAKERKAKEYGRKISNKS